MIPELPVLKAKKEIKEIKVILDKMPSLMSLPYSITMMERNYMSSIMKKDRILSMMVRLLLELKRTRLVTL